MKNLLFILCVRLFKHKVNWSKISEYQELSRSSIREFKDKLNWSHISRCQILSEDFIREFKDKVYWYYISRYQILSESFIREFQDNIDWHMIAEHQILSESFIREFKDKVYWHTISYSQVLSEDFIREFKDKLNWRIVSIYQVLSESFIREFKDEVNWDYISMYQVLSEDFIAEFDLEISKNNWNYVTDDFKKEQLDKTGLYEIIDGYIYGYKSVRKSMRSVYDKRVAYEVGKEVVDWHCDANCKNENSFGLSLWNKKGSLHYHKGILLKVRAKIEDVKALVHKGHKIRCSKLEVLGVIK